MTLACIINAGLNKVLPLFHMPSFLVNEYNQQDKTDFGDDFPEKEVHGSEKSTSINSSKREMLSLKKSFNNCI